MATLLAACHGPADPDPAPGAHSAFARPQALAFAGPYLVVANTAYGRDGWGPGALVVLDPATGEVLNEIPTSAQNPQRLRVTANAVLALNTGPFAVAEDTRAVDDGSLDAFAIETLATASAPTRSLPLAASADGRIGAPVDFVVRGDAAFAASGIAGTVWPLDLADFTAASPRFYGAPDALGLGALAVWRDHALLADFNTDRLHVLGADGASRCAVELGASARDVEGAQSLVVHEDHAYFILALAGTVGRVRLSEMALGDPDCGSPTVETVVRPAGAVPNDLHVRGGEVFVVDSGENQVVAYAIDTGARTRSWDLPVGSNPWHMAFSPDGQHFAVTAWAADAVALYALDEEAPRWWAPAPVNAGPVDLGDRGEAAHADHVVDAPGAGRLEFGDPDRAANGVQGAGEFAGGTDVYSIPAGEHLTLGWTGRRVVDGPGADLVVFENPFRYAKGVFIDAVVVEVSADGEAWAAFPHHYGAPDPTVYSPNPADWQGFAGVTPVRYRDPQADPFGLTAGGDRFDLQELPGGPVKDAVLRDGVWAVRLSAAADWTDPQTGAAYPVDPVSDGPDIDGVFARRLIER